jgi:hypothetical protein
MSGFLSNLLLRSRGAAEVMRPRVASLFEPRNSKGPEAEWDLEETRETPEAEEPRAPSFEEEPRKVVRRTASHGREIDAPVEFSAQAEQLEVETVERRTVETPLPNIVPQGPWPTPPANPAVSERKTALAQPAEALPKIFPHAPAMPQERRPERLAMAQRLPEAPSPRETIRLRESPAERRTPAMRDRPVLTPPIERPRMQLMPAAQRPAPSEPTVQVTIGRIEVRAVSEPGPRRKERAAPPVMSLNEYLKTRSGGGNR